MPRSTVRPTLEEHVEIGQAIKDYRKALSRVMKLMSPFLLATENSKIGNQFNFGPIEKVKSKLEDVMFQDFPYLTHDATKVYYNEDERADAAELMRLAEEGGMVDRNAPGSMPREVWEMMCVGKDEK